MSEGKVNKSPTKKKKSSSVSSKSKNNGSSSSSSDNGFPAQQQQRPKSASDIENRRERTKSKSPTRQARRKSRSKSPMKRLNKSKSRSPTRIRTTSKSPKRRNVKSKSPTRTSGRGRKLLRPEDNNNANGGKENDENLYSPRRVSSSPAAGRRSKNNVMNNHSPLHSPKTAERVATKRSKLRELEQSFQSPTTNTDKNKQHLQKQQQKSTESAWEQRQKALKVMNKNVASPPIHANKGGDAAAAATSSSSPSPTKTTRIPNSVAKMTNNRTGAASPQKTPTAPATTAGTTTTTTTTSMIKNGENGRFIFYHKGSPIYEWKQTLGYVLLYVKPPPFITQQNQINVNITKQRLKIGLDGKGWFINEETFGDVLTSKSIWALEDDEYKGGNIICISLSKTCHGELWGAVLIGAESRSDVVAKWSSDAKTKSSMYKEMLKAEKDFDQNEKVGNNEMNTIFEEKEQDEEPTNRTQRHQSSVEEAMHQSKLAERDMPVTPEEKERIVANAFEYLSADIRLFSSCQDDQQANDNSDVHKTVGLRVSKRSSKVTTNFGGVFTSVLLKTLYGDQSSRDLLKTKKSRGQSKLTYGNLLHGMRKQLNEYGYSQVPVLTTSHPISTKEDFDFVPTGNFTGQRKALIIGINYAKDSQYHIPGCQNDAHNMIKYLREEKGFTDDDFYILMDDDNEENIEPTRQNILKAFHRFAFGIKPGDAAFFYYAGHGKSTVNEGAWDDESAAFDQVLLPVDFEEEGGIVDDEIFRVLLVPIQSGVQVTAFVDCCHSGSIFDLPFEFVSKEDDDVVEEEEIDYRAVRFPHMGLVRHERSRLKAIRNLQAEQRPSVIERIMLQPPTKKKKTSLGNEKSKHGKDGEDEEHGKYMKFAAVEEPKDPELQKKEEERELVMLGCLLLCLNPIKLCRVLWS